MPDKVWRKAEIAKRCGNGPLPDRVAVQEPTAEKHTLLASNLSCERQGEQTGLLHHHLQNSPGQVLARRALGTLDEVGGSCQLAKIGSREAPGQPKRRRAVFTVNVTHQLVHFGAVPTLGHRYCLLKRMGITKQLSEA